MSDPASSVAPHGPRVDPEIRHRAARGYARLSVVLLYFLGFYILLAPWVAPRLLGWEMLTRAVGGEGVFLRLAVGLLFLYFATLTHEKYNLKFLTQDILEAFNMLLYGQNYRQHRAAVDAQIKRLESGGARARHAAHRALTEMTGQELPPEPEAWRAWWSQARRSFRLAKGKKAAAGEGRVAPEPGGDS